VRVLQVVDDGLVAGDGLEAPELLREVREADGVVEDAVGAVVVGVGPAHHAHHRQVLAVGAGDGVQHAYPSAAYPALSSLQQPTTRRPGSAIRWSRSVRLKSPGTANTSLTPTCTRRRARCRPSVAFGGGGGAPPPVDDDDMMEPEPGTPFAAGLCPSKDTMPLVSMERIEDGSLGVGGRKVTSLDPNETDAWIDRFGSYL